MWSLRSPPPPHQVPSIQHRPPLVLYNPLVLYKSHSGGTRRAGHIQKRIQFNSAIRPITLNWLRLPSISLRLPSDCPVLALPFPPTLRIQNLLDTRGKLYTQTLYVAMGVDVLADLPQPLPGGGRPISSCISFRSDSDWNEINLRFTWQVFPWMPAQGRCLPGALWPLCGPSSDAWGLGWEV